MFDITELILGALGIISGFIIPLGVFFWLYKDAKNKRAAVIAIAKTKNIRVHERKIKPEELKDFVGCFLTGTAAEVTPVSCIAENKFKVCEMIIDLNESYQALVKKKKAA